MCADGNPLSCSISGLRYSKFRSGNTTHLLPSEKEKEADILGLERSECAFVHTNDSPSALVLHHCECILALCARLISSDHSRLTEQSTLAQLCAPERGGRRRHCRGARHTARRRNSEPASRGDAPESSCARQNG